MGDIYYFQYDRCELKFKLNQIYKINNIVNDLFGHNFSFTEEEIIKHKSCWIPHDLRNMGDLNDIHITINPEGIILDGLRYEWKFSRYNEWLEKVKKLFLENNGILYGWTYMESNHDFFKIENGKIIKFEFDNRPIDWNGPILEKYKISIDDLERKIEGDIGAIPRDTEFSFSSDKCSVHISIEELQKRIKSVIDNISQEYQKKQLGIGEESGFLIPRIFFGWYEDAYLSGHFNVKDITKPILIQVNASFASTFTPEKKERAYKLIMAFLRIIREIAIEKKGLLWGYYKVFEPERKWFAFFKIENGEVAYYQFNPRPQGW